MRDRVMNVEISKMLERNFALATIHLKGMRTRNATLLDDWPLQDDTIKDSLFVEDVLMQVVLLSVKMKRTYGTNVPRSSCKG